MKKTLLFASVLLLSACAGSTTRDGLVYRDGSWYSPASEGHGDYYTGTQRQHPMAYDVPWAWSVGFVPYGGYCPVEYRYCTSFWADPWFASAYYPGYYPYYQYIHVARHPPRRRDPTVSLFDEASGPMAERDPGPRTRRDPAERMRTRGRGPGAWGISDGDEDAPRRPRRRPAANGGGRD